MTEKEFNELISRIVLKCLKTNGTAIQNDWDSILNNEQGGSETDVYKFIEYWDENPGLVIEFPTDLSGVMSELLKKLEEFFIDNLHVGAFDQIGFLDPHEHAWFRWENLRKVPYLYCSLYYPDVKCLYKRAVECYVLDQSAASIILFNSALEVFLKHIAVDRGTQLDWDQIIADIAAGMRDEDHQEFETYSDIIKACHKKKIINHSQRDRFFEVSKIRNDLLHEAIGIEKDLSKHAFKILLTTQDLITELSN